MATKKEQMLELTKEVANLAWNRAASETALIQQKGFGYKPETFENWYSRLSSGVEVSLNDILLKF